MALNFRHLLVSVGWTFLSVPHCMSLPQRGRTRMSILRFRSDRQGKLVADRSNNQIMTQNGRIDGTSRYTFSNSMKTTKYPALLSIALTCLLSISASAAERPNILFIVSDDHGWGDLPSNWDKTEVQMPTLDGLAANGVRFTNYHTVPLCAPSRACMFTGQYSSENGMWRGPGGFPGEADYKGIKRDVTMLSEYLSIIDRNLLIQGFFIGASVRPGLRGCKYQLMA
jgi:hypothetical protein